MRLDRTQEAAARKCTRTWWNDLQPDPDRPRPQERGGDRAALARLRRAATPLEAAEEPAAVALARALGAGTAQFEDVAVCAAVLAQVREDDPSTPVARRIGADPGWAEARPLLTPLRFRRLIEARDATERLTQFRRMVALAGGRLDVADLAVAVLDWSEWRRRDWIFRYHGGDAPAPSSAAPPTETPVSGDAA